VIIFRYLAKEILFTLLAVSGVLLLIFMSGTFVRYLAEAAAGDLSPQALLVIMGYRLPGFLELILPLGTFIGVLLAYGRLYVESEMVVLSACGLSQRRLLSYTLLAASPVIVAVSVLSLYVSPKGVAAVETLMAEQRARGEFELIMPEQFQPLNDGQATFYTEQVSDNREDLREVFIADVSANSLVTGGESAVVRAEGAHQWFDEQYQRRYFVLEQGKRYGGLAGTLNFHEISFASFGQLMQSNLRQARVKYKVEAEPTEALFGAEEPVRIAALQWRLSLPILVVVVCMLAVPLSRTNPRQGRYLGMIPAIFLYIIYLVALNAARDQIKLAKLDPWLGLWVVHGVFFALAVLLFNWGNLRRWLKHHAVLGGRAHA
jgi:lipopolysaccharide export system permease protein